MNRLSEKKRRRVRRKIHIRKKISGLPDCPRLTVYKSNRHLYVQAVDDSQGHTLAVASNIEQKLRDIKNKAVDAERLGQIIGERLKEKKITKALFDRNGYTYHGIVKNIADGARKVGIRF